MTAEQQAQRHVTLAHYGIADAQISATLHDVAATAVSLCCTPLAGIIVIDETYAHIIASAGGPPMHTMPREDSVAYHMLGTGDLVEVQDVLADPRFAHLAGTGGGTFRFYAGTPVTVPDTKAVAALCVVDQQPNRLNQMQREGLQSLGRIATFLLRQQHAATRLVDSSMHLAQAAETDALTGLANRRGLDPTLSALPPGTAVALLDLDHFKRINDSRGHEAGDQILQGFAAYLRDTIRDNDLAGRWGGEEFLLILPSTTLPRAATVVDRLRETWMQRVPGATFSAGVTMHGAGDSAAVTIARADAALYKAKQAGRNQVRSH